MSTETKFLGAILLITLLLIGGSIFFFSKKETPPAIIGTATFNIDYNKGQKIGSDSAKLKLVEFSDYECPACAAVESVLKGIRINYPKDVQLIYRNFPLTQHARSRQAATIAEAAADQGKFWEMHDQLLKIQSQWTGLTDANPFFLSLAKDLGIDPQKVNEALEKDIFKGKINEDIAEGERLGVTSTPSFFLNGHKVYLQSFTDLNTAIEEELKK